MSVTGSEFERRCDVLRVVANRSHVVEATALAMVRVASDAVVPIALTLRQRLGWERDRALAVLDLAEHVLVVAHRTYAGQLLHDAAADLPHMRADRAGAVAAVVDHLLDAVLAEWPAAGPYAPALGALLAMFVGDRVAQMPRRLS